MSRVLQPKNKDLVKILSSSNTKVAYLVKKK